MATTYRYQHNGLECGPIEFRELVQRVRDELLQADDLVIADWQDEWQPAAEVIGLFHTAGRDDVLERWREEKNKRKRRELRESLSEEGFEVTEIDELLKHAETTEKSLDRLEKLETERLEQLRQLRELEPSANISLDYVQKEIDLALDEKARQEERLNQKSIISFLTVGMLKPIFRMTMALGMANLVTALVFSWTQKELQRFPVEHPTKAEIRVFPIYGECSHSEYLFLMFDTMVLSAIAGFYLARCLELFVDD